MAEQIPQASVTPVDSKVSIRRNKAKVKEEIETRNRLIKSGINFIMEFSKLINSSQKELMAEVSKNEGSTNSEAILNHLSQINTNLQDGNQAHNDYTLAATVITECYSNRQGCFYGASLSCSGKVEIKIMIALSCIQTWNDAVAHAVWNAEKKGYIKFPPKVNCTAYKINPESDFYDSIPPCSNCNTIFKDVTFKPPFSSEKHSERFAFGNCAETESLSHLLDADKNVRIETIAYIDTEEVIVDRASIRKEAKEKAKKLLGARNFKITDDKFNFFQAQ
ncbi:uncharacterized protein LOC121307095 isoform X3 [Polyodon spathula]|uniref:uncharacterized protein LOC121307095 isoform X3 n=1 Tax=Polyodon spathula TaxID=7913 RepID=UPI001B7E117C|nr:uncharacterized protein LOC121307095 isoform X3 [Polyodon spathula]